MRISNDTTLLCVTDIHITPAATDEINIRVEEQTEDISFYNERIARREIIKRFCSEVDYTITGITTDGKNVEITFHDPKDLTLKYDGQYVEMDIIK